MSQDIANAFQALRDAIRRHTQGAVQAELFDHARSLSAAVTAQETALENLNKDLQVQIGQLMRESKKKNDDAFLRRHYKERLQQTLQEHTEHINEIKDVHRENQLLTAAHGLFVHQKPASLRAAFAQNVALRAMDRKK